MKISTLIGGALASGVLALTSCGTTSDDGATQPLPAKTVAKTIKVQQIRNATLKVEYAGTTFLIDPMLASKGSYPGFEGTYNSHLKNPLVDLPIPLSEVVSADAIIVTHTHLDHWDDEAKKSLPKKFLFLRKTKPMHKAFARMVLPMCVY